MAKTRPKFGAETRRRAAALVNETRREVLGRRNINSVTNRVNAAAASVPGRRAATRARRVATLAGRTGATYGG